MPTPAGWYPDPTPAHGPALRFWDGSAWTGEVAPALASPDSVRDAQRVEWLALVIAVIPLVGLVGGTVSLVRGRLLTGGLMVAIGLASSLALQALRAA